MRPAIAAPAITALEGLIIICLSLSFSSFNAGLQYDCAATLSDEKV
jgi:hypothetical protein